MSYSTGHLKSIYLKADLHGARLEPKIDLSNSKQREAFRNLLVIMAEANHWARQLLEAFDTDFLTADQSQT
jgi:hypothetical protein